MEYLKDRFYQNARRPEGLLGRLMIIRMNLRHRQLYRWGLSFLRFRKEDHILDIGCGGGSLIALLLKCAPRGTVEGIDYSDEAVAFARRRNRFAGRRCIITCGDVGALPYRDNSFDIITAFETVYFWPDLKRSLNGIYRVLKPDGRFLLCCETDNPEAFPVNGVRIRGMKIYTADALSDFAEAAGFTEITVSRHPEGWFVLCAKKQPEDPV